MPMSASLPLTIALPPPPCSGRSDIPPQDAFQGFLLLPAPVALGLLLGLWPLARSRRDLGDHLVMTLRKVMFAREAASRYEGDTREPAGVCLVAKAACNRTQEEAAIREEGASVP